MTTPEAREVLEAREFLQRHCQMGTPFKEVVEAVKREEMNVPLLQQVCSAMMTEAHDANLRMNGRKTGTYPVQDRAMTGVYYWAIAMFDCLRTLH